MDCFRMGGRWWSIVWGDFGCGWGDSFGFLGFFTLVAVVRPGPCDFQITGKSDCIHVGLSNPLPPFSSPANTMLNTHWSGSLLLVFVQLSHSPRSGRGRPVPGLTDIWGWGLRRYHSARSLIFLCHFFIVHYSEFRHSSFPHFRYLSTHSLRLLSLPNELVRLIRII